MSDFPPVKESRKSQLGGTTTGRCFRAMCGSKRLRIPKRYIVTALGLCGFLNIYAMRVNLSVALVAMVNQSAATPVGPNHSTVDPQCAARHSNDEPQEPDVYPKGGLYDWNSNDQAVILGSFYYGYVLTQLPGGYLAERFGAKWLFGGGVAITAFFSVLTPLAASWGIGPFVAIRIMEGLGEGVTFPSMNALLSRWAPKFERSRLSTIIFTGCQIGNVVAMPISGYLSSSELFGGWPSVFYFFGALGCLWFCFWCYFIYDDPTDDPGVSSEELMYIKEDIQNQTSHKRFSVPWKQVLTSVPVWALTLTHFGHSWGFLILLSELPSYLNVLHFNIKANGGLSALPYLVQAITAWLASLVADQLRKRRILPNNTIRKIFNSIGMFGPAIFLLCVTVSGCRPLLIVGLITVALALNGFTYSGLNVTHVDMSPYFAGTLYGITNTVSNLCGILGPAVVGGLTKSGNTLQNWNYVFYVTTAMYVLMGTVYILFASAELQPWGAPNSPSQSDRKETVSSLAMVAASR